MEQVLAFIWYIITTYPVHLSFCIFGTMILLVLIAFVGHYDIPNDEEWKEWN